ncbi:38193_t:CDS:2 [Gigaspora margarita]|uniref:38193_t:CDS:1 n=1 Tax=Gigaspora margarita TaxID=4874 RepID=A0ABN7V9D4_GIGMA|nr:38193_t:CDS:2 [Gigaspora margarita]
MSYITSKSSYNQDESNEDSQLLKTSDKNPVNDEYIKLGTRNKHGHVAKKYKYCEDTT